MPKARGFSLLVVMLVAVVLAVLGSTAVLIGTREAGTAAARSVRAQALAAAEAGLAHFQQIASPSLVEANHYYVGGAGDGASDYRWLPGVPASDGGLLEARYRVRGVGPGPVPRSGVAVVEGEVLSGGRVVGRAELGVVVKASANAGDAGRGQEDLAETGGSADGTVSNSAISLQGGAFDG